MKISKKKIENCNFCKSTLNEQIYTPINSKIRSKLKICKICGLCWLSFDKKKEIKSKQLKKFKSLSCDADYSPIRVGKAQMLENFIKIFDLKNVKLNSILDMSSAKGDFIKWARNNLTFKKIIALEKDKYMTNSYIHFDKLELIHNQYQYLQFKNKFDLIYSCHSLEHYSDPEKKLVWMYENLKYNKYLYLEVPNPKIISQTKNVDEYFYDLHRFYFFEKLLSLKLIEVGFKIIKLNEINGSICILAKKRKPIPGYYLKNCKKKNYYFVVKKYIKNYEKDINKNRKNLIKNFNISNNNIKIFFGAGRILDFLIRDGKFKKFFKSNRIFFVDNFLSKITKNLYGKKLYDENILKKKNNYDVFILAKSSTIKIIEIIKKIKKYKNIYLLSDFL
jgi:SAM-dependent methyltransferase